MMILSGFTLVLLVNCLKTSPIGANENAKRMIAPTRAIIQYVPSLTLPILMDGKNNIDRVMSKNVIMEIMSVVIINAQSLLSAFLRKSVIKK